MANNNNKINNDNIVSTTEICGKKCSKNPYTWHNILKALTEAVEAETGKDKSNVEKIVVNIPHDGWIISKWEGLPVWLSHETLESCLKHLGTNWNINFEIKYDDTVDRYRLDIYIKEDK